MHKTAYSTLYIKYALIQSRAVSDLILFLLSFVVCFRGQGIVRIEQFERKELHVIFLDLANTYGSVPHELLWAAFDFFRVPMSITNLVKAYFGDLQFSFSTPEFSTTWQ